MAVNESSVAKNYQAMSDAGLLKSKQMLTVAQVQENLQTVLGAEADTSAAMASLGLSTTITGQERQTVKLTAAKLQEAVATNVLTEAQAKELAMRTGITFSMNTQSKSVMPKWIATIKAGTKAIGGQVKAIGTWLVTSPVGWIGAIVGAVAAAITIVEKTNKKFIKSQKELIEKSDENIKKFDDEINSLNELQTKLKESKGNKEALAKIQNELNDAIGNTPGLLDTESNAYDIANQKINERIERLEKLRKLELENKTAAQKEIFNNSKVDNAWGIDHEFDYFSKHKISVTSRDYSDEDFFNYIDKDLKNKPVSLEDLFANLKKNNYGEGKKSNAEIWKELIDSYGGAMLKTSEIQDFFDNQTKYAQELLSSYIDNSDSIFSKEELNSIIESLVESGYAQDLEGIKNVITSLIEDDNLKTLLDDYYESLYDDDIDSDKLYQNLKVQSDELSNNYPELKSILDNFFDSIGKDIANGVSEISAANESLSSFSEAFNAPDFSSAKEKLLELAASGELTPETLSSTEEYKTLLSQTGLSAEDACESINKTVSAAQRLSYTTSGLSSLTDIYEQANENGFADIESIYKLDDTFKNLDSYDEFARIVGSGKYSMDEMQQAFNKLTSEYLEHTKVLDGLNESEKELYIQQLKSYGIANAQEIVSRKLSEIDYGEAINSYFNANKGSESWCNSQQKLNNLLKGDTNATLSDFTDGNYEAQQSLLDESNASYVCRQAVLDLQMAQYEFNKTKLTVDDNINELAKLASSYGLVNSQAQTAAKAMDQVKQMQDAGSETVGIMYTEGQLADMQQSTYDEIKAKIKADFDNILNEEPQFNGDDDYRKEKEKEAEKSKEIFDWIETKINRLKTVISELGETASNTFKSLTERASAYENEISKVSEQLQLQKDAYNKYMEKADSVGLSEEWASKVRDGSLDISEVTDDTLKNQIKDYQNWYDKAQDCLNTVNNLEQELAQLNIDRLQLSIDKASRNLDKFKSKSDRIQDKIDDDSRKTKASDYNRLDEIYRKQIASYEDQNKLLREQQEYVDKGSEKWAELEAEIRNNNDAINELTGNIKKNKNLRIQIEIDRVTRNLEKSKSKAENLQDKIDDDTRKIRKSDYDRLDKSYSKEIKDYKEQNRLLRKQQRNVEKGSEAWHDYQDSIDENNKSIKDLEKNIKKNKISKIQIRIDVKANELDNLEKYGSKISDKISLKETSGQTIKASDYSKLNANTGKQIQNLQAQNRLLRQQQKNVEKGSQAWNDYQDSIDSNNSSIRNLTKEMVENAKAMASLNNEAADKKVENINSSDELLDAKSANSSSYRNRNSYVNSKVKNIDKRQKAYNNAVSANKKGLNTAKKAIDGIKSNSKNKSILKKIKSYIKSGKEIPAELIQSANSIDPNLAQKCADYNAYLMELEASKAKAELYKHTSKQDRAELAKEKQENIESYYSDRQGVYNQRAEKLNSKIDIIQAKGYQISTNYYSKLIENEKNNNASLVQERDKLTNTLNNSIKNGSIKKYSTEWYELRGQIDEVTNAIDDSNKSLVEYKNQLRQIKWDSFEYLEKRISNITAESDFMINQLSRKELTSDETGGLTDDGKAVASLHLGNYEAYRQQSFDYKRQIENINKDLAKDPYNKELLERKEELVKLYQDSINGANDEKDAIIDLYTQGYDALKNKIAEVISEYEELLDAEKSAYDYQNTIADKTKQIASIKKQLAAFSNGTSEETKAKVQKLTVSLEEAEKDLKDTQYNRFISDTKDILGDLQDTLSKEIDNIIKNMRNNFDDLSKDIKLYSSDAANTITDEMKGIGCTGQAFL